MFALLPVSRVFVLEGEINDMFDVGSGDDVSGLVW